jgi:hypothetical protein
MELKQETKDHLESLSSFLTADAWSENRIMELLINVWADGYNEGKSEAN